MDDLKTVEGTTILDPVYTAQKEGVAKMRTSLLACVNDPTISKIAIQNITVLRVYHQLSRIIQYTELMDKLEAKLYASIEASIENSNPNSPGTWMMLLNVQERLQKSMIESHKLLQPYLDIKEFTIVELTATTTDSDDSETQILSAESRDRLRNSAQAVLDQLDLR